MSEPHTADLGTRYRYRQEGASLERERIIEILRARVTKHHPILTIDISDLETLIKGEQK